MPDLCYHRRAKEPGIDGQAAAAKKAVTKKGCQGEWTVLTLSLLLLSVRW